MKYLLLFLLLMSCSHKITYHAYQCKINTNDIRSAVIQAGLTIDNSTENSLTASHGKDVQTVFNFVITDTLTYYTISKYSGGTFIGYGEKPNNYKGPDGLLTKYLSKHCNPKYFILNGEQDIYEVLYKDSQR